MFAEMVHRLSIFEGVSRGILHRASSMLGGVDGGARVDITPAWDSRQPTRVALCSCLTNALRRTKQQCNHKRH